LCAVVLIVLRVPLVRLVYLHGQFSQAEMLRVVEIMPAWIGYFLVTSLNILASRYLFATGQGGGYLRRQLCAYGAANLGRLLMWGRLTSSGVIWWSVAAEGCALLLSARSSLVASPQVLPAPLMADPQEVGL
jgi:peptidoglycan biosynthesis protein MviN/MurJ (putative lipid II flippase)